jgi:hypothetical protein
MVRYIIILGLYVVMNFCSFGVEAHADSIASDGDQPTVISDEDCRDVLRYYRSLSEEQDSIIPPELMAEVLRIAKGEGECQTKVGQIGGLLDAFWATDPWCKRDRQRFTDWLAGYAGSKISSDTKTLIWTLLESNVLACYEALSASHSIARHFDAESLPQEIYSGVVMNAGSSEVMDVDQIANKMKRQRERRKEQRGRCSRKQSKR